MTTNPYERIETDMKNLRDAFAELEAELRLSALVRKIEPGGGLLLFRGGWSACAREKSGWRNGSTPEAALVAAGLNIEE